eukprot:2258581-Pyramimonas_sp.AAC.1
MYCVFACFCVKNVDHARDAPELLISSVIFRKAQSWKQAPESSITTPYYMSRAPRVELPP